MANTSQAKAVKNYRKRLTEKGLGRFEVVGLEKDRDLIRQLAKRLAGGDTHSSTLRAVVRRTISAESQKKGGILKALLASPLAGADIEFKRPVVAGRKIDI